MAKRAKEKELCIPSIVEGAAMAMAAKREKTAMVNFMLLGSDKELESTGDKGMTWTKCDERSLIAKIIWGLKVKIINREMGSARYM